MPKSSKLIFLPISFTLSFGILRAIDSDLSWQKLLPPKPKDSRLSKLSLTSSRVKVVVVNAVKCYYFPNFP